MRRNVNTRLAILYLLPLVSLALQAEAQTCPAKHHPVFSVAIASGLSTEPLSGRLIVLMSNQLGAKDKLTPSFGPDAHSVWVAAKEIHRSHASAAGGTGSH